MSFITDNFITNFFFNSAKTDEDLDKFINKKFTYYLNNSNLLLNFISDFEDYKINRRNDNKSKCDECESLYILTSEIFENYINKVKIPFKINIYSEGKEKSNINYNNKVLYFFDLKDLNKILQSKNLARSNEDTKILNKKRILCKIISLSFIKIYIIIKSIYQTFNIYSSLIKNKSTIQDNTPYRYPDNTVETQDDQSERPLIQPTLGIQDNQTQPALEIQDNQTQPEPTLGVQDNQSLPLFQPQPQPLPPPQPQVQPVLGIQPMPALGVQQNNTNNQGQGLPFVNSDNAQSPPLSGGGFFDFLYPFPKEIEDLKNEPQEEVTRIVKLQKSSNVFYSIFVILFENTEIELTSKNFSADYLNNKLNTINNENLSNKLPDILEYICSSKLYMSDFILKNSIIFNDDNFKFLRLKTSDTLENDAMTYLKELDDKNTLIRKKNAEKFKALEECFTTENIKFIENYCSNKNLDFTNLGIANSVKSILQKMITNYFKNRNKLYDSVIKKIIKFNTRTNEIENIIPNLTYAIIVDLTEETKNILLDLHINIFKSLNSIIYQIIKTLKHKYGNQLRISINDETPREFNGGKTKKRNYKNYKNYKKNKKYSRK